MNFNQIVAFRMSFGGEGLFDVFSGESGASAVEAKTNGEGKRKMDDPVGTALFLFYNSFDNPHFSDN